MDADPKPHLLGCGPIRILFGYGVLYLDSTFNGINCAGELGNKAIARGAEDPAPMRGDQSISDDPVCGEGAERAHLIPAHEAAVTLDIGGENRGELSFDRVRFHGSAPPRGEYRPNRCEIRGFLSPSEARW